MSLVVPTLRGVRNGNTLRWQWVAAFGDNAQTDDITPKTGNVLTNDVGETKVVFKVNGSAGNVGVPIPGTNGGLFTIWSNGVWTFDPNGDFAPPAGPETESSVSYHVNDGAGEAEGSLSVGVTTLNAAPWTPAQIATALWLKDSGTVASWTDHSGNGFHAVQGVSNAQPQVASLNDLQVLNFDGGDYMLTPNIFTTASDVSIFIVKKATSSNTAGRGVFALSNGLNSANGFFHALCRTNLTNGFRSLFTVDGGTTGLYTKYPPVLFTTSSWVISGHGRSATSQFLSWNGTHSESAISGQCSFVNARGVVGGYYDTVYLWSGQIAEIIVCSAYVDSTTRQKIEGYLAHKWGLTANLPSDHPYKVTVPTV